MLKPRPHAPNAWAAAALRCGVIVLGTGLLSAAAATSAEAASLPPTTAHPAAHAIAKNLVNTAVRSTRPVTPPTTCAHGPIIGTVIARSGLEVHTQPSLQSPRVLPALPWGTHIDVWCHVVNREADWYKIRLSPQRWVAGVYHGHRYVAVPDPKKIPGC